MQKKQRGDVVENIGQLICDNLNWNVCQEAVDDVNNGLVKPDRDYHFCLKMIETYKTKENYVNRADKGKKLPK